MRLGRRTEETTTVPRGTCQGCAALVLLIGDGRCGLHLAYVGRFTVVVCPGGGVVPVS